MVYINEGDPSQENQVETLGPLSHSGDLGIEKPAYEFDNTPLNTVGERVLTAPDDLATLPENMPVLTSLHETGKKRKSKVLLAIGAAGAAGIAVVGGVLAFGGKSHSETTTQNTTPTTQENSVPVSSAETPTTAAANACPPASQKLYDKVAAELWPCMTPDVIRPEDKITSTDAKEIITEFYKQVEFSVNNELDTLTHLKGVVYTDDPNNVYMQNATDQWVPLIKQNRANGHPISNIRFQPDLSGLPDTTCPTPIEGAECKIPGIFNIKATSANSEIISPEDDFRTTALTGTSFIFHDGSWRLKTLNNA